MLKRPVVALAAILVLAVTAARPDTLDQVKKRGYLACGSNPGRAGFGLPDRHGHWAGLDIDFCRALAAAIFDDAGKVKFVPLTAKDRFAALQSGAVDALADNTTWRHCHIEQVEAVIDRGEARLRHWNRFSRAVSGKTVEASKTC